MHFSRIRALGAWGLGLILLTGPVRAEPAPDDRPAPPPATGADPTDAPLSGPKVRDGSAPADPGDEAMATPQGSLIERDFEGRMKPLDVRPEEAALGLLGLSESERLRCGAVLEERAAVMDRLVRENIDLLLELRAARAGGDQAQIRGLTARMREVFKPLGEGGGLLEKLAAALPKDKSDRMRAMINEYYLALADQERQGMDHQDAGPAGERRSKAAALVRVSLNVLGQEIKRSYERIAAEGTQRLERLIAALELNDEQEGAMRRLASEYAQKTRLNPSGSQRAELFTGIMKLLSPAQRVKFAKYLREEGAR